MRFRRIRKVPVYGDKKVKQDYTVQSHEIHQKLPKTDQPKIGFIKLVKISTRMNCNHMGIIIMKSLSRQYFHLIPRILKEKKIPLPIVQLIKTTDRIQPIDQLYQNEFINHHQVNHGLQLMDHTAKSTYHRLCASIKLVNYTNQSRSHNMGK